MLRRTTAATLLFMAGCAWMPGVLSDEERKKLDNHEQMSLAYGEATGPMM